MFEVAVEKVFAAGHALRDYNGRCENIHGHNYRVRVLLEGDRLDGTGLLVDFLEVEAVMKTVIGRFDHMFLNEVAPFDKLNPSAENMAQVFYEEISRGISASPRENDVRVSQVSVWETDEMRATYKA
ncbi:MAG: 6-carboxytetrahydropterin synthase QueD [Bryobacteraceae bacterium]